MTQMTNKSDVQRWSDIQKKYYEACGAAYELYKNSWDKSCEVTDQAERTRLREAARVYWRDRCQWHTYQCLAEVREYMAEFGFEFPGVVIPDTVFDGMEQGNG